MTINQLLCFSKMLNRMIFFFSIVSLTCKVYNILRTGIQKVTTNTTTTKNVLAFCKYFTHEQTNVHSNDRSHFLR